MSFGNFLLDEGVVVDVSAPMETILDLMGSEVPNFSYDGCAYHINLIRGIQKSHCKLLVKAWDVCSTTDLASTVGIIQLDTSEDGATTVQIPARHKWSDMIISEIDEEGKLFSSFVFQLLNALQDRRLIELPGPLPVR